MVSRRNTASRRPAGLSWQTRELRLALLAGTGFAVSLALVAYFAVSTTQSSSGQSTRPTAVHPGSSQDLTTGPILFMPVNGNTCRQRLIDNATGQIRDNGTVDCETALAQSSGKRLSGTRVEIIRDGFFKK